MGVVTKIKKAGRKVERAVTGEEPEVDVLDTLKEEHEEVAALLKKLVSSDRGSERKSLLRQIKQALVPHVRAEERIVYEAIIALKEKQFKQDGEEGYLEHALADKMLSVLGKIDNATSPEFGAAAKVLKELVEHHVQEEESNVWSDMKKNFSSDERKTMNRKYLVAKRTIRVPD
jgi:hypothetical protein